MEQRGSMKARARKVLKKHYWMCVALCLVSAAIGSEFSASLAVIRPHLSSGQSDPNGRNESANSLSGIFLEFAQDIESGKEKERAEEAQKRYVEDSKKNKKAVLGRSRGVLAGIVNKAVSGAYLITLSVGIRSIVGSDNALVIVLIVLSILLMCFVQIFIIGVFKVVTRRMLLEARCYDKVPPQRALFLLRVRKWGHAGLIVWMAGILESLWTLTIIGGVIKHYSYILVPYIVAENPEIKTMQAITLSRRLMKGHKWECFKIEMSFLGWIVLGRLTLGILDILFTNPYILTVFGEYYDDLRLEGKKKGVEGCEFLNDRYLFERPAAQVLEEAYEDVKREEIQLEVRLPLSGVQQFLAENFGLLLKRQQDLEQLEQGESRRFWINYNKRVVEGEFYPIRLCPLAERKRRNWIGTTHFLRYYSVWSLTVLFFAMSFLGWLWEVSLHLVIDGQFVNRGVLHGPWLPIYGVGSILILLLLYRLRKHPVLHFFAIIVLCGGVEYFSSYLLEKIHHGIRWWDYTGYFLNLNGRICAEGLLVFGLGGMAIAYVLAPLLDSIIRKVEVKRLVVTCVVLLSVFAADQIYSVKYPNEGKGITDYESAQVDMKVSVRKGEYI